MILGAAIPMVAGAAALPLAGEAAIAMGAPALAARAVTGAAGGAMMGRMGAGTAMVAREASYQARSAVEQQAPIEPTLGAQPPQANPALDQLLANNDLTPFPNIQRALQESGGMRQLQHAFGSLNGQPLHPELNANAAPVDPQSLLAPEATTAPIDDGVSITGPTAPDEY